MEGQLLLGAQALGLLTMSRTPYPNPDLNADVEAAALVALLRQHRSWSAVAEDVEIAGSALRVLRGGRAGRGPLFDVDVEEEVERARRAIEAWRREGIEVIGVLDDAYPANLAAVHQRSPILFVSGSLAPNDVQSVAIVGTGRPSAVGIESARVIAAGLADYGVTVVSGLASGIDTAAHSAALDSGGRTVAVIGNGIRRPYPSRNRRLAREIGERGLILSQFWPDTPPRKQNIPMRDAVMSGYALATVVIEGGSQSGARMQATLALEQGRRVFLMRSLLEQGWARLHAAKPNTTVIDGADDVLTVLDRLMPETAELTWP